MNDKNKLKIESEVLKKLLNHLQKRADVQNIDLMILANFCRNCLGKWYAAAAEERGIAMDYEQAREAIYGMPYKSWKKAHQLPATKERLEALEQRQKTPS